MIIFMVLRSMFFVASEIADITNNLRHLPSGEHFAMKNHHAINGKIHYFNGHFQLLC